MTVTNPFTQLFLPAAVAVMMFALGTTLSLADLRRVWARPRGFVLGVVAHALLLPALAFGVAILMGLPGPLAAGLVLIASCPANPTSNLFTHLARGDTMLSVCLTAGACLTSVVTVPLFVNAALNLFPTGHRMLVLPAVPAALALLAVSTPPALAGMLLRHLRPAAARAVEKRLAVFGLIVIVLVVLGAVWSEKDRVAPALAQVGAPALLLNTLSVAVAFGLAAVFGLSRAERVAVGLECGLQNFAMAAFVALTLMDDATLLLPAIAYGLTMWLSAFMVVILSRRSAPPLATIAR